MTIKQKLILYLISCEPGVRDIYGMIKIYDRADFPSKMSENLKPLLEHKLIYITKNFDNGTPSDYAITEKGKEFLCTHLNNDEMIEYIKSMQNPTVLLKLVETYMN